MRKAIFLLAILALSVFLMGCSSEKAGQAIKQQANEFEKLDSTLGATTERATDHAILATQVDLLRADVDIEKKAYDGAFDGFKKDFDSVTVDIEKVRLIIKKSRDKELMAAFNDFDKGFQASRVSWADIEKPKSDFDSGFIELMSKTQDLTVDAVSLESDFRFSAANADNVRVTALMQ